jgi:isopentenyl diphosphate isomerase/L-lactate dehydrogenase-like FMN-dependent dehydrogenase
MARPGTARSEDGAIDPGRDAFATVPDIFAAARDRLAPDVWDYLIGGAGTEATIARNRAALDALLLEPRVLRDVGARTTGTSFAGIPLALPAMLAPVGTISLFAPDGASACARAAHRAGTAAFVGVLSVPVLEEVAAASPGPLVFQLYVRGDRAWMLDLAQRAEAAGYAALCITVDSPVDGRRERDLRRGFAARKRQARPNLGAAYERREHQATLRWEDVEWLRGEIGIPILLKGVTAAEDAVRGADVGVAGIVVSNHGGRQLDHQRGAVEALALVADAVGDRVDLAVDGGFLRGADVVKALGLGARAVLVGRLMCAALAAGGEDGLVAALELLRTDVDATLALLGARSPADVERAHVAASPAPWR